LRAIQIKFTYLLTYLPENQKSTTLPMTSQLKGKSSRPLCSGYVQNWIYYHCIQTTTQQNTQFQFLIQQSALHTPLATLYYWINTSFFLENWMSSLELSCTDYAIRTQNCLRWYSLRVFPLNTKFLVFILRRRFSPKGKIWCVLLHTTRSIRFLGDRIY